MRKPASFPALELRVPETAADLISGLLWQGGTCGLEEQEDGVLRAHFELPPPETLLRRLRAAGAGAVRRVRVPVQDWVAMGRAHVRSVRVGPFLVRPPWSRSRPRAGQFDIVIDPARAFGTGNHESTRLVLAEIARARPLGASVLDVGSGSGILALAALRMGAVKAVACDTDPDSVLASRENAARNGLGAQLRVHAGSAGRIRGQFALVLANLTASILESEASAISSRVQVGGTLIVSGFLERDAAEIVACFATHALVPTGRSGEGEWVALSFTRPRLKRPRSRI